jgi:hypothetical protein
MAVALLVETPAGLVPSNGAAGFWGRTTLAGQVVSGVVGRAVERGGGDSSWRVARLTVDLVRMTTFANLQVSTSVVHTSRRITVVEAVIEQDKRVVARGTGLLVKRVGPAVANRVWSAAVSMPPPPETFPDARDRLLDGLVAFAGDDRDGVSDPDRWSSEDKPKYLWWDLDHELVAGEQMSPLTRAAFLADTANPLTGWGTDGLKVINADVTLTLARDPEGTVLGLEARDYLPGHGATTATAVMHDRRGPIGTVSVVSLPFRTQ